jgi:hypothetical protein
MVWIITKDKKYFNSELITSFVIVPEEIKNKASIICKYAEFSGMEVNPTSIELWNTSFETKLDPNSHTSQMAAMIRGRRENAFGLGYVPPSEKEEYDPSYNDRNQERIGSLAKDIMIRLLTELNAAAKNGEIVFDLELFLEQFNVNDDKKK